MTLMELTVGVHAGVSLTHTACPPPARCKWQNEAASPPNNNDNNNNNSGDGDDDDDVDNMYD